MKTETYILPAHWASWLINADESGLSDDACVDIETWLSKRGLGCAVDCEEYGFMWNHDAAQDGVLAAECARFTFIRY